MELNPQSPQTLVMPHQPTLTGVDPRQCDHNVTRLINGLAVCDQSFGGCGLILYRVDHRTRRRSSVDFIWAFTCGVIMTAIAVGVLVVFLLVLTGHDVGPFTNQLST